MVGATPHKFVCQGIFFPFGKFLFCCKRGQPWGVIVCGEGGVMTMLNRREAIGGLAAGAAVAGFGPAKAQSQPKIAFTLLFEPGGDVGWDPEHMRGVNMARAFHGDAVQIDTFHSVREWGKGDKEVFQRLVADGYDMIFTTSAGYMQSTIEVAFEAPNVLFENCAGYIRSRNVSTYNARWYEGRTA